MKTKAAIVFLVLSVLLLIAIFIMKGKLELHKDVCIEPASKLYINDQYEITDPIVRLLGQTGIRIEGDGLLPEPDWPKARLFLKSRSLKEVVPAIQGKTDPAISWLGDLNKERWEQDQKNLDLSLEAVKKVNDICLQDLRQADSVYPKDGAKGILFLGAALSRVRMRLSFLNQLYDKNQLSLSVPVFLLTGERTLDERVGETQEELMNQHNGIIPFRPDFTPTHAACSDEGEMVKLVFLQSRHQDLKRENIHYVYSKKGDKRRATTESTVVQWLHDFAPQAGHYVAISNQPYVVYQEAVINRVLLQANRPDICVSVVGPGMHAEPTNEIEARKKAYDFLSNISRILYEYLAIEKSLQK